jgi:response regulator RpfG family c-di-GMP phosphodiesterase
MQNNINILQKLHILFVDDEKLIREIVSDMLSDTVGSISLASNGQEGLEFYLSSLRPIDIVISDQTMPVMHGLDMLEKIKEYNPAQKCIMITAHSESKYMLRAIEIGVEHFIVKPIIFDRLEHILSTLAYKIEQERFLKEQEKLNQYQLIEHAFNTSLVFLVNNIPLPSFIINQQDLVVVSNSEINTILMGTIHYKKFIDKTLVVNDILSPNYIIESSLILGDWKEEFLLIEEELFFEIEDNIYKPKMKRILSDNNTPFYLVCLIQETIS